eukprot:TRINITY_DN1793_c0_g2_i1.p1 TRINITY_DN1793_c0_g2~~TRINITY_DN1793_c0_g2_i1.p1  ORF type:complete len:1245 (+),score=314.43 TRINITY_DN1793_c0_g2_i1:69-3803(+)
MISGLFQAIIGFSFLFQAITCLNLEVVSSASGEFKKGVESAIWKVNNDGGAFTVSLNSVSVIDSSTDLSATVMAVLPKSNEIDTIKDNSIVSIGPNSGNVDLFKDVLPSEIVNVRLSAAEELHAIISFIHNYDQDHIHIYYEEAFLDDKFGSIDELYAVLRESDIETPVSMKINSTSIAEELTFEGKSAIVLASVSYIDLVKDFVSNHLNSGQTVSVLSNMREIDSPGVVVSAPIPRVSTSHSSVIAFKSICDDANTAGTTCDSSNDDTYEGFVAASVAIAAMKEVAESETVTASAIKTFFSGSTTLNVANTWYGAMDSSCNRLTRTVYGGKINASGIWEETFAPFIFESCGVITKERETVYLGQVAAFTGPSANLGKCMNGGILSAFHVHNNYQLMSKYILKLKTADDGYDPDTSISATEAMIADPEIFALIGSVGTPTSKVTFPLSVEANIPFVGPFTGAEILRRPFFEDVVNVRASYYDETAAMTEYLVDIKQYTRISIMYQNDSFGKAGYDGLLPRLASRMLWIHSEGTYERNTVDIEEGVNRLFDKDIAPEAIVYFGTADPMNAFVRNIRDRGWMGIVMAVSFVGAEHVSELLELPTYRENIIVTQAVPSPSDTSVPLVVQHIKMLKETVPELSPTFCSLEGFLAGGLVSIAIDKSKSTLSRDTFLDGIYESGVITSGGVSLGPYGRMTDCVEDTAGCMCNQGSKSVFLTKIEPKGSLSSVEEFPEFSFNTCGFHDLYEAPECDSTFWEHTVSECEDSGTRDVVFSWKLPYPKDPSLPWNCQNGDPLPASKTVNCEYLQPTTGVGIVLLTIIAIASILLITLGVWVYLWKGRRSVNNGQPILLIFGILGAILTCGAAFLLLFPPSNWRCIIMPALGSVGFTLMNASLCMKVWRIKKIFLNRKLQKRRLSVSLLLRYMVYIVILDILILAAWVIVDHPDETTEIDQEEGFQVIQKTCETGQLFALVAAYKFVLVIASCYLSFKIRNSPDRFNESKWIFLSTYNVVLVFAVVAPIIFLLPLEPATDDLILCLGLIFAVTGSQLILVFPKLLSGIKKSRVHDGKSTGTGTHSTTNGTTADSVLASVDKLSTEDLITELVKAKKQIVQLQSLTRNHRDKIMSYQSQMNTVTSNGRGTTWVGGSETEGGSGIDLSGLASTQSEVRTLSAIGHDSQRRGTFTNISHEGTKSRVISQSNGQGHILKVSNPGSQLKNQVVYESSHEDSSHHASSSFVASPVGSTFQN